LFLDPLDSPPLVFELTGEPHRTIYLSQRRPHIRGDSLPHSDEKTNNSFISE
jgi:hypothetical protein